MSWGYTDIVENVSTREAVTVASAASTGPLTESEIEAVRAGTPEQIAAIQDIMSQGLDQNATANAVRGVMGFVGNDVMAASATGLELSNALGIADQQRENGRSSFSEEDTKRLLERVESRVKDLMLAGASDAEIQQVVGDMAPPELRSVAQAAAAQQVEATKNPFGDTRNDPNQAQTNNEFTLPIAGKLLVTEATQPLNGFVPNDVPDVREALGIMADALKR